MHNVVRLRTCPLQTCGRQSGTGTDSPPGLLLFLLAISLHQRFILNFILTLTSPGIPDKPGNLQAKQSSFGHKRPIGMKSNLTLGTVLSLTQQWIRIWLSMAIWNLELDNTRHFTLGNCERQDFPSASNKTWKTRNWNQEMCLRYGDFCVDI